MDNLEARDWEWTEANIAEKEGRPVDRSALPPKPDDIHFVVEEVVRLAGGDPNRAMESVQAWYHDTDSRADEAPQDRGLHISGIYMAWLNGIGNRLGAIPPGSLGYDESFRPPER